MRRRPVTRTNGGQSSDAAPLASSGRATAATVSRATPRPPNKISRWRLAKLWSVNAAAVADPLVRLGGVTRPICPIKTPLSKAGLKALLAEGYGGFILLARPKASESGQRSGRERGDDVGEQ